MNRHKEVDRNEYSDHPVAQRWLVDSNFASNTILRANHPTAPKPTSRVLNKAMSVKNGYQIMVKLKKLAKLLEKPEEAEVHNTRKERHSLDPHGMYLAWHQSNHQFKNNKGLKTGLTSWSRGRPKDSGMNCVIVNWVSRMPQPAARAIQMTSCRSNKSK